MSNTLYPNLANLGKVSQEIIQEEIDFGSDQFSQRDPAPYINPGKVKTQKVDERGRPASAQGCYQGETRRTITGREIDFTNIEKVLFAMNYGRGKKNRVQLKELWIQMMKMFLDENWHLVQQHEKKYGKIDENLL